MDPSLLLALMSLLGGSGNSYYPYGASPQSGTGSGLDALIQMFSTLFPNSRDQSLGNYYAAGGASNPNNPYINMYGQPSNLLGGDVYGGNTTQNLGSILSMLLGGYGNQSGGNNAASALFQYLFGPQAQQQAINYQQTQPQTQWYNPNNTAPQTQTNTTATGTYQSPYNPAVQQSTQHPAFTGYNTPTQQGQGYSPYQGPGGYIEVNGKPVWAPGTGALGGTEGSGGMTRIGLPAGTQTPTAWGPLTLGDNGRWSGAPNMPNTSTFAHGLYDDVPSMVGPNGQILYNPGGANGQPFDETRGWVTWEQMDDITTALYQSKGLPLPAELAAANAARAKGQMPQQSASLAHTGFPGYVAPGTVVPYNSSTPGYVAPAATTTTNTTATTPYQGTTGPTNRLVYDPVTGHYKSVPWNATNAPAPIPSGPPAGTPAGQRYWDAGLGRYVDPVTEGKGTTGPVNRLVPGPNGGYTGIPYNAVGAPSATTTTPTPTGGHSLAPGGGGIAQPGTAPASKSGVAPWWDPGIGKWYDSGTNTYY